MKAHRIASELFAHEILFLLGIVVGAYSIWNLLNVMAATPYLSKLMVIVRSAIAGRISHWLLSRAQPIDVNYNEPWYREVAFEVIWGFFPPMMW